MMALCAELGSFPAKKAKQAGVGIQHAVPEQPG
jgi:hypothetical protein